MEPVFGICPVSSWNLISERRAKILLWSVSSPPELMLPAAWQVELMAQVTFIIGKTSAVNLGAMPVHGSAFVPLSFVQAFKRMNADKMKQIYFFNSGFFKLQFLPGF